MKTIIVATIFSLLTSSAFAFKSGQVEISGVIHKDFDEEYVRVQDEFGQILQIPRGAIPEGVKIQAGQVINVEVPIKDVAFVEGH